MKKTAAHPKIVSQEKWLAARKTLLTQEKKVTRQYDRVAAERRHLPMVKIEKDYLFQGTKGKQSLLQLFEGQKQLIVYHFMFDPEWTDGCPGCTGFVDALGDISMLEERNTRFVLISHAPLAKLKNYQKRRGWNRPWYSSFGSEFNYDFHVTFDEAVAPVEYNYRTQAQHAARGGPMELSGEGHGLSVFYRVNKDVYHTYSAYARGVECVTDSYSLLDVTPLGRQEDWEDSPKGWPQKPTYGG